MTKEVSRKVLQGGKEVRVPEAGIPGESMTKAETGHEKKKKIAENCPNLWESREGGRRWDSPWTVSWVPPPNTKHCDTGSYKNSPWEALPHPRAPHLQLRWRKWGQCSRLVCAQQWWGGGTHPPPLADDRTNDPMCSATGSLEAILPKEVGI